MKRKLIKRNKEKNSKKFSKYGYYIRVFERCSVDLHITKYRHRYTETIGFSDAFRMFDDEWIWIPIYISSKNKKSRIQNKVYSYLCSFDIDEFNKTYGTSHTEIADIPIKD